MRIVRILAGIVVALLLGVGLLFLVARMGDGPMGPLPGGPLVAGERVTAPVSDWSFAESIDEIEMQLAADAISRTTWILVDGGRAFIPASLSFPPGKDWYRRADVDGAAWVRIEGRLYPVTLIRVRDEPTRDALKQIAAAKYAGGPPRSGEVWFFALQSRAS